MKENIFFGRSTFITWVICCLHQPYPDAFARALWKTLSRETSGKQVVTIWAVDGSENDGWLEL